MDSITPQPEKMQAPRTAAFLSAIFYLSLPSRAESNRYQADRRRATRTMGDAVPESAVQAQNDEVAAGKKWRVLFAGCLAHITHDGFTDMLYVFFPIWQQTFPAEFFSGRAFEDRVFRDDVAAANACRNAGAPDGNPEGTVPGDAADGRGGDRAWICRRLRWCSARCWCWAEWDRARSTRWLRRRFPAPTRARPRGSRSALTIFPATSAS